MPQGPIILFLPLERAYRRDSGRRGASSPSRNTAAEGPEVTERKVVDSSGDARTRRRGEATPRKQRQRVRFAELGRVAVNHTAPEALRVARYLTPTSNNR